MNVYRIMNRVTKKFWEGEANSAQEACEKAGWMIGNCWVRVNTSPTGWGKPEEFKKEKGMR